METLKKKVQARKLQLDEETIRCAEASTEPDILFAGKGNGRVGRGGSGVAQ